MEGFLIAKYDLMLSGTHYCYFEYNSLYNKIKNYDEKKFSFWLGV